MTDNDHEYRLACLQDDLEKLDLRLTRLENTVYQIARLLIEFREQNNFIIQQILRIRCDVVGINNKTPYRRLNELEESFQGFLTFYHDIGMKKHVPKPKKKEGKGLKIE